MKTTRMALLSLSIAALPGCGFYTYETECELRPDEGQEVDGDLVGIQSVQAATKSPPEENEKAVDGRAVSKVGDRFTNADERIRLQFGGMGFELRTPAGPGSFRLEDLDAKTCEGTYYGGECGAPRGDVEVTDFGADSIDLVIRIDDAPLDDGPVVRGSVRLLFKRWQHQVCNPKKVGSESAFAIKY